MRPTYARSWPNSRATTTESGHTARLTWRRPNGQSGRWPGPFGHDPCSAGCTMSTSARPEPRGIPRPHRTPAYLIRDRDAVYSPDCVPKAAALGVRTVLTPVRAPRANAIAERLVGTLRRECLDHMIVVNERHLRAILSEFVEFYNADRPRRSLDLETPR